MEKDDHVLIEETLAGQLTSYDMLMQRYQNLIYKICYSFGKNKENALDIVQNVFLKAFENLKTIKGRQNFKSWLSRIAFNEGINWTRKFKNRAFEDEFDEQTEISNYEPTIDDELIAREHKHELLRSLFALNTRYRLAVVLRYYQEMPIKEIAEILNCSEGVVKNMLYRSLQRLKLTLVRQLN